MELEVGSEPDAGQPRPTRTTISPAMRRLWTDVEKIDCPTLVMRGAKSDVFSDENAEKFANTLSNGRWVRIPDAGHTVQGDNPRDDGRGVAPVLWRNSVLTDRRAPSGETGGGTPGARMISGRALRGPGFEGS